MDTLSLPSLGLPSLRRAVHRIALFAAALTVTGMASAGCGSSGTPQSENTPSIPAAGSAAIPGCSPSTLETVTPGKITIGVDNPVYPPWFNDNSDPIDGNGFESAIDLAIAKELGYTPSQIQVKRVTFSQAIGPAARDFDYDLDEFSITKAREQAVDFSAPYYNVAEAIVAMKGTPAASATTLAQVRQLKLGAQSGSTDQETISDVIKPVSSAFYGSNSLAVQALKNGQINGLVVDLPTR